MLTLALEAATSAGSVAVLRGAELLAEREVAMRGVAEERLLPAIDAALTDAGATTRDLTRIACGAGPGSFTSLRVSASIAKGIAFAHALPLYALPSLALIAADPALADGKYVAIIDALRGELFAAVYERIGGRVEELTPARLVSRTELTRNAEYLHARVIGPAEQPHTLPRAANVVRLMSWLDREPVSLTQWEPDYGRLAEAQVTWERAHGRPLGVG